MTTENKDTKFRISGYVSVEIYEKLVAKQNEERIKTGKKPTMGQIIEQLLKD